MKKILLTTTESLFGWEIETYLKPIFSHVVIGAGFMSDFSASLTDFFGGRSNSYEKKLQALNDSALQILQSKASEIGANCIIGIKVNVQQISGKNVQMFMVSAYGTAVIAKSTVIPKMTNSLKEIDKSTVADQADLIRLLNAFEVGNFTMTMGDLQRIVESRSGDFKNHIFNRFKKRILETNEFEQQLTSEAEKLYFEYFSVIDPGDSINVLYNALLKETNGFLIKKVLQIIKTFDLVDYGYCAKVLNSESLNTKKLALEILTGNKRGYVYEDISEIMTSIATIKSSFPSLANLSKKKGFYRQQKKKFGFVFVANPIHRTTNIAEIAQKISMAF